jgi:hypothetical protein
VTSLTPFSAQMFHLNRGQTMTTAKNAELNKKFKNLPFKYEAQTALFKDPVRTAL